MVSQSLYRRYRPARFGEIVGQAHVVAALRNAVATDRVGHAYLFSGPRGTGKTSTARILAKALNCGDLTEGEPCGTCASCIAIGEGTSYELHELDAASNNKVDDIRELVSRVAIGTPGRAKVYVLDEVHMLTPGAENALLKTLEEPPSHVVFVLCTTESHKVTPTIRSRTQHLLFELLDGDLLEAHVRAVAADAGFDVSEEDIAYVLGAAGGSARDALSALDAVAAAGRAPDGGDAVAAVLEAVATGDTAGALTSADAAARAGQEPRILGEALLGRLRNAFLASVGAPLEHLPAAERAAAGDLAGRLRPRAFTFSLELLGEALVGMREAPDPRVDLDLALVRLTNPDMGLTLRSLAERVERLEGSGGAPPERRPADPPPAEPPRDRPPADRGGRQDRSERRSAQVAAVRETLARAAASQQAAGAPSSPAGTVPGQPGASGSPEGTSPEGPARASGERPTAEPHPPEPSPARTRAEPAGRTAPGAQTRVTAQAEGGAGGRPAPAAPPDRDEAVLAWAQEVLPALPKTARALLAGGRFLPNAPGALRVAMPTAGFLARCEPHRADVEAAFARCFERPVTVEFVRDDGGVPDPPSAGADGAAAASPLLGEILASPARRAPRAAEEDRSGLAQVQQAFPGSRLVELEDPGQGSP